MRRTRKNLIRVATGVLVLSLLAFAVWTVRMVTDVRGLRAQIEGNVSELQVLGQELAVEEDAAIKAEILEEIEVLRKDSGRVSRELGARWSGLEAALIVSLCLIGVNVALLFFAPGAASAAHRLEVMGQSAQALGVGVALIEGGRLVQVDPSLRALVSGWSSAEHWWGALPRQQGQLDLRDPAGKRRVMELRVIPQGEGSLSLLLVEDVTDLVEARESRVALRERLANADRLATAGLLAAGLGHEIKNPLTLVRSNLELLELQLDRDKSPEDLRRIIERGLTGVDRVDQVIQGMRKLSRSEAALEPLDLRKVLASTLDLASAGLSGVQLEQELEPVPLVRGDAGQLGQVVLNLLINAGHALEGLDNPRVTVRLYALRGEVCIEVQDNGPGVPAELRKTLFEPLVTSRPAQGGTGLGLAICQQIVEDLEGSIALVDQPLPGALLRVSLPAWSEGRASG